jgi:capsular polysaccharide biosynthesis protein
MPHAHTPHVTRSTSGKVISEKLMVDLRYTALRNTARIRRKLFGLTTGYKAAEETIVVHPADEMETSEAISLPGEIERAIAAVPSSSLAEQRRWASPGILPHGQTTLYRLRDAYIAGDEVHSRNSFDRHGRTVPPATSANVRIVDEGLLCEAGGATFFGHWLCDNLCTELLATEIGMTPLSLTPRWMHETGYRKITGLDATNAPVMAIKDLWLVDDRGYNRGRIARYRHLRNLVRNGMSDAGLGMVYIARGLTGTARNLVNDQEVRRALTIKGFAILEPERSSPQEIVDALSHASLIVSIEGSAICHALLALPPKAGMIIIQPPDHFNIFNKIIGDFSQLRTGFVVAEPDDDGFRLDISRLLRTIDLVVN